MSPLVALVSDFGRLDSYVAEMHAAIVRRVPTARVLDVTHDVPPFDRLAAALVIERTLAQLPRGAALAAVVDPGVGTTRGRIFARREGVWLIGPDNGLLPLGATRTEIWRVREGFLAPPPGVHTFDGREVFAPLAALLAAGLSPALAGVPCTEVVEPVLPPDAPFESCAQGVYARGMVIGLDRYGNAVTNVRAHGCEGTMRVQAPARFAGAVRQTYGEVAVGEEVALIGSSGRLELAVREGASGVQVGEAVVVQCVR